MIAIQLFGISESKSLTLWVALVQEAMKQLEVEFDVKVVNDLNEFMQYDLAGIPALLIGDQILFQKEIPTLEEVKAAIQQHLEKKQKEEDDKKIELKILFPPLCPKIKATVRISFAVAFVYYF
ncbi:MAG: thioredoxin family protein [Saprospiraceae bacterium]